MRIELKRLVTRCRIGGRRLSMNPPALSGHNSAQPGGKEQVVWYHWLGDLTALFGYS